MNDALKNPFIVFIAGLIAIWLLFKVLRIVLSLGWLLVLVFVVMFVFNPEFRGKVQRFFAGIFNS